jgi:hypothetical protein
MFFVFYFIKKYNLIIDWQGMENISTLYRLIAMIVVVLIGSAIYLGGLGIGGVLKKSIFKKIIKS